VHFFTRGKVARDAVAVLVAAERHLDRAATDRTTAVERIGPDSGRRVRGDKG